MFLWTSENTSVPLVGEEKGIVQEAILKIMNLLVLLVFHKSFCHLSYFYPHWLQNFGRMLGYSDGQQYPQWDWGCKKLVLVFVVVLGVFLSVILEKLKGYPMLVLWASKLSECCLLRSQWRILCTWPFCTQKSEKGNKNE